MSSFGETLKRERELREITLREISDATKINIRYLEALEQNRFDTLPGGLFNRGFIRAYATYVGLDGEAMVNSYLQEMTSRIPGAPVDPGLPPGLHRPAETPRRRAAPPPAAPQPPSITFASPSPARAPQPVAPADATRAPAAETDAGRGLFTHIEAVERHEGSSRALTYILGSVGLTAILFVVLGLALHRPSPRPAAPAPAPGSGAAPATAPEFQGPAGGAEQHQAAGGGDAAGTLAALGAPPGAAGTDPAGSAPAASAIAAPAAAGPAVVAPENAPGPAAPPEAAATPIVMELHVRTDSPTWVQLFCDGQEAINWVMRENESRSMSCLRMIRVSAADAAALRLWVNGAECAALGEMGARVHGYTIRVDDYAEICPPAGFHGHGR